MVLVLCALVIDTLSQPITFNVITFNPCDSTYENEILVRLESDDSVFQISDTLGTIKLRKPGEYKLKVFGGSELYRWHDADKLVKIAVGENYDTLVRSTIYQCVKGGHHSLKSCGYYCCDKPCEGYNADYYHNGIKRIEGTFRNGFPIGMLLLYYANGKDKEVHLYDNKGEGNLISIKYFEK